MTFEQYFSPRFGLGWLIALIVLVLCIVLAVVGSRIPEIELGLIGALALARLV